MIRLVLAAAFALGFTAIAWVGAGFVGSSWIALAMTLVIAGVYLLGAWEIGRFRAATASLEAALAVVSDPPPAIGDWLGGVHPSLRHAVRLRIEGERVALPGPALTPYLVGLLVMLGMLGTFLGMVVTFKGAVFALEGSTDLLAIRSALAAPIRGLGLAFGTSVAGVAASAMLGLMSAISRRERAEVVRLLDHRMATVFRPLSLGHQRQEAFRSLQVQAQVFPALVDRLQAMMDGLERRSQQLNEDLLGRQAQFHRDTTAAYTGLAGSVEKSLSDSLRASARAAGESLTPVVAAAMAEIAQESRRMHERVSAAAQMQLTGLSTQFSATASTVAETWMAALEKQAHGNDRLFSGLDQALAAFTQTFEQRSGALLASVGQAMAAARTEQALADQQQQATWTRSLEDMAATLRDEWQRVGAQTLAQQQAVCQTLEKTAIDITGRASQQASRTMDGIAQLMRGSEVLIRSRMESESTWTQQQGDRMDQLATLWRTELGALRTQEDARGQAAVERLGELQTALASHLATLGAALEAPLTRLLQTASEVPQAASEVIAQLRQEMSRLTERDNRALDERTGLVDKLAALVHTLNQATGEQRVAIESLVASAATVLETAGAHFSQAMGEQSGKARDVAAHLSGSAVELSSLGASFGHGVEVFTAANDKLLECLQRIEGSIQQSMARSDEQLAYYVAQAREVIDLSITSQQGLVEDLRRLDSRKAALPAGVV